MYDRLELAVIGLRHRAEQYLEELVREEKGASDIVAILVIIVILIAVAGVFKNSLMELIDAVFTKVTQFVNE